MKKFFNTKVKAVLALTVVLAVALALLGALGQGASLPQRIVQGIMTPLRSAMNDLTRHAEKLYSYIFRYEALEAENQALREQIAEMENDARTTDTLQRENQRLRELPGGRRRPRSPRAR